MLVDFSCKLQIQKPSIRLTVFLNTGDGLLQRTVPGKINLQCLLLGTFCSICPVTFRCFLHTVHIRVLSPANPHLLEVASSLMVVQRIDSENLLTLYVSESQNGCNILIPVLELGLVKQNLHIRVVDDGLLHNRGINHVIKLLSNHTGYSVELPDGLIQILYIFRHSR